MGHSQQRPGTLTTACQTADGSGCEGLLRRQRGAGLRGCWLASEATPSVFLMPLSASITLEKDFLEKSGNSASKAVPRKRL